jgi:hypothetical protein
MEENQKDEQNKNGPNSTNCSISTKIIKNNDTLTQKLNNKKRRELKRKIKLLYTLNNIHPYNNIIGIDVFANIMMNFRLSDMYGKPICDYTAEQKAKLTIRDYYYMGMYYQFIDKDYYHSGCCYLWAIKISVAQEQNNYVDSLYCLCSCVNWSCVDSFTENVDNDNNDNNDNNDSFNNYMECLMLFVAHIDIYSFSCPYYEHKVVEDFIYKILNAIFIDIVQHKLLIVEPFTEFIYSIGRSIYRNSYNIKNNDIKNNDIKNNDIKNNNNIINCVVDRLLLESKIPRVLINLSKLYRDLLDDPDKVKELD